MNCNKFESNYVTAQWYQTDKKFLNKTNKTDKKFKAYRLVGSLKHLFKGGNWINFCTHFEMETGSSFVHFWGGNWVKFCTLFGVETGSSFVHFLVWISYFLIAYFPWFVLQTQFLSRLKIRLSYLFRSSFIRNLNRKFSIF